MGDHRYTWNGEAFRVVVAGDVVALPREHWSDEGYSASISEEWLLHSGRLPSRDERGRRLTKLRLRILAYFVRRGLADAHGYELEPGAWPVKDGDLPRVGR